MEAQFLKESLFSSRSSSIDEDSTQALARCRFSLSEDETKALVMGLQAVW